jgi:hypothetical protein
MRLLKRNPHRAICLAGMVLALTPVLAGATPAPDAVELSPVQIYWRAQAAVNRLAQPPYIAFTFENQGYLFANDTAEQRSVVPTHEFLRAVVRVADGSAVITALKNFAGQDISRPRPFVINTTSDYFAVSNIFRLGDFPLADFGLRYGTPSRPGFFEPAGPLATASPLHVIATVVAFEPPPYKIVNLGDATVGGQPVYHLGLDPLREPSHNVLRQMWIDKTTFLPVRYVALRTVIIPDEYLKYLVTVDSAVIDEHIVNVGASGNSSIGLGKWHVSDVSFPASEPDWVFDRAQWARHDGEVIPNLPPSTPAPQVHT